MKLFKDLGSIKNRAKEIKRMALKASVINADMYVVEKEAINIINSELTSQFKAVAEVETEYGEMLKTIIIGVDENNNYALAVELENEELSSKILSRLEHLKVQKSLFIKLMVEYQSDGSLDIKLCFHLLMLNIFDKYDENLKPKGKAYNIIVRIDDEKDNSLSELDDCIISIEEWHTKECGVDDWFVGKTRIAIRECLAEDD